MDIRERLTQILTLKEMTPSNFADILEIQRSNMSHYLNGRNKPSIDILQKILTKFPDINANWLMTGRGEITIETQKNDLFSDFTNPVVSNNTPPSVLKKVVHNRKVDKITVYFDDGTFQNFIADTGK